MSGTVQVVVVIAVVLAAAIYVARRIFAALRGGSAGCAAGGAAGPLASGPTGAVPEGGTCSAPRLTPSAPTCASCGLRARCGAAKGPRT